MTYGSNTIMVSTRDSYFDTEFEFTTEQGLMIAFGLTAYDDNFDAIEDPSYGHLKAYYKTWGMQADAPGVSWDEIPTSQCTAEQLGLVEAESSGGHQSSRFYPTHKNSENDLKFYHRKFKCVDAGKLKIQGDYNSAVTRSFVI